MAYGAGNFLFVCLEALLQLQLSITPQHIPFLRGRSWDSGRYTDYWRKPSNKAPEWQLIPRDLWYELQTQIQTRRETLLSMPSFMAHNFRMDGDDDEDQERQSTLAMAYNDIKGRYERHVEWLELFVTKLKDVSDFENSEKSIAMAELSIKESKRMMLCKSRLVILPEQNPGPRPY
jgi:hypothetical protein